MSHRLTKEELDEQFELFLKESVSDDSLDLGNTHHSSVLDSLGKEVHKPTKTTVVSRSWWNEDEDSEDSVKGGLLASGKTFRKSLRKSQSIQVEDGEKLKQRYHKEQEKEDEIEDGQKEPVIFSRDSLEPEESMMASGLGPNVTGFGLDTLDEEKEKAHFFANLERGASSTIDYSKLNRELDSTGSTLTNTFRRAEEIVTKLEKKSSNQSRSTPVSPSYSEDFEEEMSGTEAQDEKISRPGMLSKVSLHDSLDSTGEPQKPEADVKVRKDDCEALHVTEAPGTTPSYCQSGASDVEALQEAYRQIDLFTGDSADHIRSTSPPSDRGHMSLPVLEYSRGAFKATIGTESDLPTAEELMRPIRPDLGFTEGSSQHLITSTTGTLSGCMSSNTAEPAILGANKDVPATPIGKEDMTGEERHSRILEEVKQIMLSKDDDPRHPPPLSKKKQVSQHTFMLRDQHVSSFSSKKKTDLPQVKNKKALSASHSQANATSLAVKPPLSLSQKKPGRQSPKKLLHHEIDSHADPGLKVSDDLQSFATFLPQHVENPEHQDSTGTHCVHAGSCVQPEASKDSSLNIQSQTAPPGSNGRETSAQNVEDCPLVDRLNLQLARKQKELREREEELVQAHNREVLLLKQENYVLQTKLNNLEEVSKKRGWSFGKSSDPITDEKLKLIEKEMKEQEVLIQGYHQENEKLYQQLKAVKSQSKVNEEAMFIENQRLQAELVMTKEQIKRNCIQRTAGNAFESDQNLAIADLETQVQAVQKREARLMEEMQRLKQEKQALEVDMEVVKKERDLAKQQVINTSGDKTFEIKMLEERHKEEMQALQKRLQWYAENQEMLDRDAARLRTATEEIHRLKEQVQKLKDEVGKQNSQQHKKAKERAGDAKRILDLERQVKEMEEIVKRRHPNSLPALILAAASAAGTENPQQGRTVAFLERRVHRLEGELEARDEEAKQSLRAMEQQYHKIKIQYEERISELENQLDKKNLHQTESCKDLESKAQALEEELESLRVAQKKQESDLQAEISVLQEQLKQYESREKSSRKSPSRHERKVEVAQGVRIDKLTQELAAKSKTVQELTRTVERLQRERRSLLTAPTPNGRSREPKQQVSTAKEAPMIKNSAEVETFPLTLDEKNYQPLAFSGSHISEVLQENEQLKACLKQLELETNKERAALQATVACAEGERRRVQEDAAEQLSSLRAECQRERESLIARHALEHSLSKVAELTNQLSTQEIMIKHLQGQVRELQGCKEALSVSRIREETLQNEVAKLLKELKEAKETHTPELKHFTSLERKIKNMELRHAERERELQQVITQTQLVAEEQQQREVEGWRRLAQTKARELETFRIELDSILDVLRELQKQGVVIPVNGAVHLS